MYYVNLCNLRNSCYLFCTTYKYKFKFKLSILFSKKKNGISTILNYSNSTQDSTQLHVPLKFSFILIVVAGLAGTEPCGYLYTQTQGYFCLAISGEKMFYTDYIITSRGQQSHANQLILEPVGSYFIIIILSWLFWPFFIIVSLKNTVHKLSYVNREQQQMQFFKNVWRYASVSKHWFATAIYVLKYHY